MLDRFKQALQKLQVAYGESYTKDQGKLYWSMLQDIPIDAIELAVDKIIQTRTYKGLPNVAEIREAAMGKVADRATALTMRIERLAQKAGSYKQVYTDDPVLNYIIFHYPGGWVALCEEVGTEQWPFTRKDIERRYASIAADQSQLEYVPPSESRSSRCWGGKSQLYLDGNPSIAKALLAKSCYAPETRPQIEHKHTKDSRTIGKEKVQKLLQSIGVRRLT